MKKIIAIGLLLCATLCADVNTFFAPTYSGGVVSVAPGVINFWQSPCTAFASATSTASITSFTVGGTGVGKLYLAYNCTLVIQYPSALALTWSLSGITAAPVATPNPPSESIYLADINIDTSQTNKVTGITSKLAVMNAFPLKAGTGIKVDPSLGVAMVGIDTATIPTLGGTNPWAGTQDFSLAAVTGLTSSTWAPLHWWPYGAFFSTNDHTTMIAAGTPFSGSRTPIPSPGAITFKTLAVKAPGPWEAGASLGYPDTGTQSIWSLWTPDMTTKLCDSGRIGIDSTSIAANSLKLAGVPSGWMVITFPTACTYIPTAVGVAPSTSTSNTPWLVNASDTSTAVGWWAGYYNNPATYGLESLGSSYSCYAQTNGALTTGSGGTLAMKTNLSSVTWSTSGSCVIPLFMLGNLLGGSPY